MKTIYRGVRLAPDQGMVSDVQVNVLHDFGTDTAKLGHPLTHFPHHSPTGFNWGYQGSGPADLALAILLDHLKETPTPEQLRMGQPLAWRLHQFFKRDFVAGWSDSWELADEDIDAWLASEKIERHVKEHAKLWRELDEYVGHDLSPPVEDLRMMSTDPAYRRHDAPTVPLEGDDDARE